MRILCAAVIFCGIVTLTGCGRSATVTGRVTCNGKPVKGEILFSPKGDSADNKGPAVPGVLDEDGRYKVELKTYGTHRVRITPSDLPGPEAEAKPYPCKLETLERDVNPGLNEIVIDLAKQAP